MASWNIDRVSPITNYMWVHTTGTGSGTTAADAWHPSFRVPTTHIWEYKTDIKTRPETVWEPDTLTVDKTVMIAPGGDMIAPDFEKRIKDEMMQMVQEYINGMMPLLIDVIRNAPSMFGVEKRLTEGIFCFNCGAPIIRGMEQEPCPYCGR